MLVKVFNVILQDLDVLGGIEWEAIIVDECQCSKISSYLEQIKMLKTDLRILLFSGQLKVCCFACSGFSFFPNSNLFCCLM